MKLQLYILLAVCYSAVGQICTSKKNPALAARLTKEIPAALKGRKGVHAVSFFDRITETTCHLNAGRRFLTASIIKTSILAAAMRKCQNEKKTLTPAQKTQAHKMITVSDNAAATALYNWVTIGAMKQFYKDVGMPATSAGPSGTWGSSSTTSGDQLKFLMMITSPNAILTNPSREYVLDLMSKTVPAQRWGTPAGVPPGTKVHVKNGWYNGWINSLGVFTKPGKDYLIAVLTEGNANDKYGHQTIEGVARVIHKAVG